MRSAAATDRAREPMEAGKQLQMPLTVAKAASPVRAKVKMVRDAHMLHRTSRTGNQRPRHYNTMTALLENKHSLSEAWLQLAITQLLGQHTGAPCRAHEGPWLSSGKEFRVQCGEEAEGERQLELGEGLSQGVLTPWSFIEAQGS